MVTELSSSVKYTVLIEAFNQAKKALHGARLKKKVAKEAYDKSETEDISKMERHSLFFNQKREKHRFKAKKAKLKFIREQLRLWFKQNPNETTPDMLIEVNERIKNLGINDDGFAITPKKGKDKIKKLKKDHLFEIDKKKKIKHHKQDDDLKPVKIKHKSDAEVGKDLKYHADKKNSKEFNKVKKPKNFKSEAKAYENTERNNSEKKSSFTKSSKDAETSEIENVQTAAPELTIIEGIGLKVQEVLHAHNISTFSDIVKTPIDAMRQILKSHKLYVINPTTWAEQAQLVIDNKMDELKALQSVLKYGKRV